MIKELLRKNIADKYPSVAFDILIPPDSKMGDYSINLAFVLAKKEKKVPAKVADEIISRLSGNEELGRFFKKIEPAGSGFINFYLSDKFLREKLTEILEKQEDFGSGENKKFKINLEFVSANPTGPLTVANIRAASFGDTLANVLKKSGYDVTKEYYINDAGNQVRLLGESVAKRYLRLKGKTVDFPDNLYQGEYIIDIAREVEEKNLAGNIDNFDELVGICRDYAVERLINSAKKSLTELGVNFDEWFPESKIRDSGEVENAIKMLEKGKHVYDKDGARWFKVSELGGDKDAVIVKSDGSYSYLAGDIAYTRNKFIRGTNKAINIWGTDHHGDVPRLLAGVKALGYEDGKLEILLHQLVLVKKGDERQKMSKRKGEFVLLDELLGEVGKDAIRFFFLMKDLNTHMEFDVDLAKEQSNKNPVFYIQYAHARLNQIFGKSKMEVRKLKVEEGILGLLKEEEELVLMRKIAGFPELIDDISKNYQVHHLAQYSLELARDFHNFYEKHRVVQPDEDLERVRLQLCRAVILVLKTTLNLMGLSAPDRMDGNK